MMCHCLRARSWTSASLCQRDCLGRLEADESSRMNQVESNSFESNRIEQKKKQFFENYTEIIKILYKNKNIIIVLSNSRVESSHTHFGYTSG